MVCCSSGGGVVGTAVVAACAGAVTVAVTAAVPVVLPLVCSGLLHSHPRAAVRTTSTLSPQPSANFPVSCGDPAPFLFFCLRVRVRVRVHVHVHVSFNTQSFYTQVPTACCPHTRTRTLRGLRGSPTSVASVSFSISVSVSNSSGFGSESDSDSG